MQSWNVESMACVVLINILFGHDVHVGLGNKVCLRFALVGVHHHILAVPRSSSGMNCEYDALHIGTLV